METSPTYKLAVIIVNYNVEYFLDQCLSSVKKAIGNQRVQVIVVDNDSRDGSVQLLENKHSWAKSILNTENVGFSRANNQAIKEADAQYILLLNPDTVLSEDTLEKVINFMDDHPEAGGLGVRMVDGLGHFLPESKRGLPKPWVAFSKMFGLSKLFPSSKRFAKYHAGHIGEFETAEIDVLSGAFMLLRSAAVEQVGMLDEEFFMYGEDIDLSYRITKGGYKNYYFPETTIIHYKGESTKKSSINYVFVFYRAMVIFARKHFSGSNAGLFSLLINAGIYLRAFGAISSRILKRTVLPIIDLTYIVGGMFLLTEYWKSANIEFPEKLIAYSIPIYGLVWFASVFVNGGYDKPLNLLKYAKGVILGTLGILVVYALLPKALQFSRLFILVGASWSLFYYWLSRLFLHFVGNDEFTLTSDTRKNFIVIGERNEFQRVRSIIERSHGDIREIYNILPNELSRLDNTKEYKRDEIIFCSADITNKQIIRFMSEHRGSNFNYKIAPENSDYLIGSNSIDTVGELYIININTLGSNENVRKKRLFDLGLSTLLILTSPVNMLLFKDKKTFLLNLFRVFSGRKSFIGFREEDMDKDVRLPRIKAGVLSPCDALPFSDQNICDKMNILYARDYSLRKDVSILLRSWNKLDRSSL